MKYLKDKLRVWGYFSKNKNLGQCQMCCNTSTYKELWELEGGWRGSPGRWEVIFILFNF